MKISVETTVAAPIEQVWRAYTTLEDIEQWNAASDDWHTTTANVDLRVGGAFSSRMEAKDGRMGFDFAGTYTKIVEHELIEYSFGDRTAQVEFADSPNGVKVRVTFDSEPNNTTEEFKRRSKAKTWKMVRIAWTDSAIEDLSAIGESLVELPEPKPKK